MHFECLAIPCHPSEIRRNVINGEFLSAYYMVALFHFSDRDRGGYSCDTVRRARRALEAFLPVRLAAPGCSFTS